jgi:RNA polymerase sigma-70 factor, ECF subfamily
VNTTSASLLERLRRPDPAASDWQRLHGLYAPLIRSWLARVPGVGDESNDLAQEVLLILVRELPAFQRQRDGSFRAWLRRVTVNRVRTWRKARQRRPAAGLDPADNFLSQLDDPASDLSQQWDQDHDRHVLERLLAVVKPDFESATWEAFQQFALQGHKAADVAVRLGLSENAVILAKARILKRLREEAAGLLD